MYQSEKLRFLFKCPEESSTLVPDAFFLPENEVPVSCFSLLYFGMSLLSDGADGFIWSWYLILHQRSRFALRCGGVMSFRITYTDSVASLFENRLPRAVYFTSYLRRWRDAVSLYGNRGSFHY